MRKFIFLVCFGLILVLAACGEEEKETEDENTTPTPVEVEAVETGDFVVEKTGYGQTTPSKQMPVMLEQPGEVKTLNVKNGDTVNKDDNLASIKKLMGNDMKKALMNGVEAQLQVKEGSFQLNENHLLMIVDLDKLNINYAVTANARDLFTIDKEMTVYIDEESYKATVTSIDTVPNETGQYAVQLELDNEDEDILPGVPAEVLLAEKKVKDTKIVPTEAVITEGDEQFVFIVRDDHVERIIVDVKETQSETTAVEAELKKDDQVVVNG